MEIGDYGKPISNSSAKGKKRKYAYYRCIGTDAYCFGGQRICSNKQIRTDLLEQVIWDDVCSFLSDPCRIEHEYERRLKVQNKNMEWDGKEQIYSAINKLKKGISRLIDAYEDGLLEKNEFEPRIRKAKCVFLRNLPLIPAENCHLFIIIIFSNIIFKVAGLDRNLFHKFFSLTHLLNQYYMHYVSIYPE